MIKPKNMKAVLGQNVFKHSSNPHIKIVPGREKDERLKKAVYVCPAGLYSVNEENAVELNLDGCLECGTCRIACGPEVLDWYYPDGGSGVQFRCG
jgi:ferredoxin like protein